MHIETGLQTFSQDTYDTVQRRSPMNRTVQGLEVLCSLDNVEIHGDLIGGLPGATRESQLRDLLALVALRPAEIQLENLKLLPGTPMCEFKEIVAAPTAPYEVLRTATMSYDDLCQVSEWSRLIDWYYNSSALNRAFVECIERDSAFFENFHAYMRAKDAFAAPLKPERRFTFLRDFLQEKRDETGLWELAKGWFAAGFSPERGLFPAQLNREGIPSSAKLLEGEPKSALQKRQYVYQAAKQKLYIAYGKGCLNSKQTVVSLWA
jgi:hypothetical protein